MPQSFGSSSFILRGKKAPRNAQAVSKKREARLVQEEPQNMGAWTFIEPRLRTLLCTEIAYAGREASASPAVGALVATNASKRVSLPTPFRFNPDDVATVVATALLRRLTDVSVARSP